jgi:hypothetical protein
MVSSGFFSEIPTCSRGTRGIGRGNEVLLGAWRENDAHEVIWFRRISSPTTMPPRSVSIR